MLRRTILTLAVLAAAPLSAQEPAKGAPPNAEEMSAAADTLSVFVSAFNAETLGADTKAGLLRCLYANPLGTITRQEMKVFAANKTANLKSPSQRLYVIAKLCGAPITTPGKK